MTRSSCGKSSRARFASAQSGVSEVLHAADGKEGLAELANSATLRLTIDLIFCDVHMPVMDGLKFLAEKPAYPAFLRTPVIMITSDPTDPLSSPCHRRRRRRIHRKAVHPRTDQDRDRRRHAQPRSTLHTTGNRRSFHRAQDRRRCAIDTLSISKELCIRHMDDAVGEVFQRHARPKLHRGGRASRHPRRRLRPHQYLRHLRRQLQPRIPSAAPHSNSPAPCSDPATEATTPSWSSTPSESCAT